MIIRLYIYIEVHRARDGHLFSSAAVAVARLGDGNNKKSSF